jgi:hypothetical protein
VINALRYSSALVLLGASAVISCLLLCCPARICLAQSQPWVFPASQWDESKTPEDFGMIRAKLDAFRDRVHTNSTSGAGVVIKSGYLTYKWGQDTAVTTWTSASKPCISTMLFAAVNEGKVTSVDSLIRPLWTNWSYGTLTGRDANTTFRHLADMKSCWRLATGRC